MHRIHRFLRRGLPLAGAALLAALPAVPSPAQDRARDPEQERIREETREHAPEAGGEAERLRVQQETRERAQAAEEPIFGRQLMTEQEIRAHREKMRSLPDEAARQAYREEHHARMLERARERGVTLPEAPPAVGAGRGPGPAAAPGSGEGAKRGAAQGQGRGPGPQGAPGQGPGTGGMGPGDGRGRGR